MENIKGKEMIVQELLELGWVELTAISTATVGLVWLVFEGRGRHIWAPKSVSEAVEKIEKKTTLHESRIQLVEQRCSHSDEMLRKAVIEPLQKIGEQNAHLLSALNHHGEDLASLRQATKDLGRNLDTLRVQVDKIRDR